MINSTASRSATSSVIFAVMVLAGCSASVKNEQPGPAAQATGLGAQQTRITDERILSDRRTLDNVQQRLRKLNEAGIPQNNYSLAKAQCWLDTAKTQYHENDRTGYIEESLAEAVKITQALEADKSVRAGYDTPLVARSTMLREDLWAQLSAYKTQAAMLACNARTVACAEVRLVRAGHAEEQTGWRQATPHVQMVEDALRTAKIQADSCLQSSAVAQAPLTARQATVPAVSVPNAASTPAAVSKETYVLLTDTLFKFDKSGADDMIQGGQQRLADVAQRLKNYKSIQTLTVIGYTDRLGSSDYNDKLSEARAKTVQAFLESLGVKSASSSAQGKGKRDPTTKDCSTSDSREQQISCLQADRRVTIEVTGIVK
ncbi:MAG: OmpA family protein [Polaromonas sp.]|nr:OmpA family protein [Polaromonas sp.]